MKHEFLAFPQESGKKKFCGLLWTSTESETNLELEYFLYLMQFCAEEGFKLGYKERCASDTVAWTPTQAAAASPLLVIRRLALVLLRSLLPAMVLSHSSF